MPPRASTPRRSSARGRLSKLFKRLRVRPYWSTPGPAENILGEIQPSAMTIDQTTAMLKSIAELAGVLVWPAVVLFLLTRYGTSLREFLDNLSEFSIKGGGFEAAAKRRVEVAAALGGAVAAQSA